MNHPYLRVYFVGSTGIRWPDQRRAISGKAKTIADARKLSEYLLARYKGNPFSAILLPDGRRYCLARPLTARDMPQIAEATGGRYNPKTMELMLPRPDHETEIAIFYGVEPSWVEI